MEEERTLPTGEETHAERRFLFGQGRANASFRLKICAALRSLFQVGEWTCIKHGGCVRTDKLKLTRPVAKLKLLWCLFGRRVHKSVFSEFLFEAGASASFCCL